MFKPLLRTLPTLSGNVLLGCKIDKISKTDKNNIYETDIQAASLYTAQRDIFTKKINVNLGTGKWEYDIRRFYTYFSDIFYKDNYLFNKKDYKKLNLLSAEDPQDSRNKDYEFGCRRIQYSQYGYQFQFYAPIYIDDVDSLPDYFEINIRLNSTITKKLRINIANNTKYNYLRSYLTRYIDKIDDNVIYCLHDSNQATYFGIDVVNGGLIQLKDDLIGVIYNKQLTINNFDYTICQGFERKKLIMQQVIPLSFMFNVSDLFDNFERKVFMNGPVKITGYYYKNGIRCDFYDFDINYTESYPKYKKYNQNTGTFSWVPGYKNDYTDYRNLTGSMKKPVNVMNIDYPSLNESRYIGYKYTNKLTPLYGKWKLKYSSDKTPYITNMSWAYSYLQAPNYKYGTFPTMFRDMTPEAEIQGTNLVLPVSNNIEQYYTNISKTVSEPDTVYKSAAVYNILESNYISEWYNIYTDLRHIINNKNMWCDVKDNTAYYNGILYNLNNINNNIYDKFGVFLNIEYNHIDYDTVKSIYSSPLVISFTNTSGYKIPSPTVQSITDAEGIKNSFYNIGETLSNGIGYISVTQLMKSDPEGMYIEAEDYYERNTYYRISDVNRIIDTVITEIPELRTNIKNIIYKYRAGVEGSDRLNNINYSVEILPYANINNIFEQYKEDDGIYERVILTDKIFADENMNTPDYDDNEYIWLKNLLYVVTNETTEKKRLQDVYKSIRNNEMTAGKLTLFLYNEFISKQLIANAYKDILSRYTLSQDYETALGLICRELKLCQEYNFIPYSSDNDIVNTGYFKKSSYKIVQDTVTKEQLDNPVYKQNFVYLDTYNLIDFMKEYIKSKQESQEEEYSEKNERGIEAANKMLSNLLNGRYDKYNFYAKFISRDHIKEYIYNTHKNEQTVKDITVEDMESPSYYLKKIYVKTRISVINKDDRDICVKDMYIPLSDIIVQSSENLSDFLNRISVKPFYDNNRKFCINVNGCIINNEKYFIKNPDSNGNLYFELCFNKDFILMDDNIKTMVADTDTSLAVYLYRMNDGIDKNTDMFPVFKQEGASYIHVSDGKEYNADLIYNIYNYLEPLYTDIYINETDINNIERLISTAQIHNITVKDNNDIIYAYTDNDTPCFIEIDYNYKKTAAEDTKYYSPYLSDKIEMIKAEGAEYDPSTNINTYTDPDTGLKYMFYLINIEVDNSSNTFKIKSDDFITYVFNYINGHKVTEEYIESIFKKLHPFIKKDIFMMFVNTVNTILFQTPFNINITYSSDMIDNGYTEESEKYRAMYNMETIDINDRQNDSSTDKRVYDIKFINNRPRKIKLLRYFNRITPLITKTDHINNCYGLKYKNFSVDAGANNIYNDTVNIYKYPGLYVKSYNNESGEYYIENISQYEYKHFNDNKMYNMKTEMNITYPGYLTYDKLIEKENHDTTIEYFKKCINNIDSKEFTDNEILFLFNKYKVSYLSEPVKLNIGKTEKLYTLTYKFTLV